MCHEIDKNVGSRALRISPPRDSVSLKVKGCVLINWSFCENSKILPLRNWSKFYEHVTENSDQKLWHLENKTVRRRNNFIPETKCSKDLFFFLMSNRLANFRVLPANHFAQLTFNDIWCSLSVEYTGETTALRWSLGGPFTFFPSICLFKNR